VLYPSPLNRSKIAIMVLTPPGYDANAAKRYPVVYNLHGAGGGSPARQWARTQKTLTHAMESGAVSPMITVFVNGLGDTGYLDYPGPSAPKVFSSVVTELIPFIDANYRTIADRSGRAIEGFSMGGGGAMMIATKRPDLFSSVVSYGGAFMKGPPNGFPDPKDAARREMLAQFGAWELVRRNLEPIRTGLRVRMVCGDQDSLHALNVEFKDFLGTLDIPVSWVSVAGVAHDTKGLYDRVGVESLKFMQEASVQPAGSGK
jgi:endo-1,4-beta-xylanase